MIYPVVVYGSPILRKKSVEIDKDYPDLDKLIEDMYDTMYKADGIGLAAPQVGKNIRIFVVDATEMEEESEPDLKDFKKVFINPEIIETSGVEWPFNEGCLSLPNIREDVVRDEKVLLKYYDENFEHREEEYSGIKARIILHEYDHLEGILFIDHISLLRKRLLKGKLNSIIKGTMPDIKYKIKLP